MSVLHMRAEIRARFVAAMIAAGVPAAVIDGGDRRPIAARSLPVAEVFTGEDEWSIAGDRAARQITVTVRLRVGSEDAGASCAAADALALAVEVAIYASEDVAAACAIVGGGSSTQFAERGDGSIVALEVSFTVHGFSAVGNPAVLQS
jgi:hypothetical protein